MGLEYHKGISGALVSALWHGKKEEVVRVGAALSFGADFIFLIGRRFERMSSDTTRSERHIPLFEFSNVDDFVDHIPYGCQPVCVELDKRAKMLPVFCHPERAVYILGPEDGNVPEKLMSHCTILQIPSLFCLNVATAGSIIMYDRKVKEVTA